MAASGHRVAAEFRLEKLRRSAADCLVSSFDSTVSHCLTMPDSFVGRIRKLFRTRPAAARLLHQFDSHRTSLEQQFFSRASTGGTPRGLIWLRCEWQPTRVLLRDRTTGGICLLASVNVAFAAVEGGDMEDVAAVSMIRDASAVFQLTPTGWQTSGRALFNMNPAEALQKLNASYQPFES